MSSQTIFIHEVVLNGASLKRTNKAMNAIKRTNKTVDGFEWQSRVPQTIYWKSVTNVHGSVKLEIIALHFQYMVWDTLRLCPAKSHKYYSLTITGAVEE